MIVMISQKSNVQLLKQKILIVEYQEHLLLFTITRKRNWTLLVNCILMVNQLIGPSSVGSGRGSLTHIHSCEVHSSLVYLICWKWHPDDAAASLPPTIMQTWDWFWKKGRCDFNEWFHNSPKLNLETLSYLLFLQPPNISTIIMIGNSCWILPDYTRLTAAKY